jgi:hypothetical protein
MNENPNFTLKPIDDLKDHHFFIPDYQRGYKWDVQQVLDLLEDLKEFQQVGNSFYCLQPLAVTQKTAAKFIEEVYPELNETNKIYEVIDGQQRLTTIHIILQIIEQQGIYNINYETRKRSAKLLTAIASSDNFGDYSVVFTDKVEDLKKAINDEWAKYIKGKNNDFNNIDFYYFFTAYLTIKAWFSFPKNEINKSLFAKKIKEQVQFVWYNETHEKDKDGKVNAKKVFRNLNSGKIPLTNAELIKALFINDLKDDNKEIQQLKQTALAREWDLIETTLQDDDDAFWYFINNETNKNRYQTRIDFLFELLTKERPKNNADKLFTYRQYAHDSAKLDWNAVKQLFLTLKEWFENRRWYHLIGFIIDRKISTIREIREEIKKDTIGKKHFEKHLVDKIKAKFHKQTIQKEDNKETLIYEYDLERLEYDNKVHYKYIVNILLLHNIETYQKDKSGYRFPFHRFKNTKWSLEHIHAQNSGIIETENEETENPMHAIQNLTLLDGKTNSSLKDNSFDKKRELIKGIFEEGERYIPICTKNVFFKYYSSTVDTMDMWTEDDQTDYLKDIRKTLSNYLPKTMNNDQSKN